MKYLYLSVLLLSLRMACIAGPVYTEREYAREPKWISMITDTSVNYFEAEKAFRIYFEHHDKPAGEEESIGGTPDNDRKLNRRRIRAIEANNRMRMEVKKYERWHDKMRPFVQSDGAIMTPSQRLEIWRRNTPSK
jgi:hypothetical protein